MTPELRQSLEQVAALAAEASEPWWVIGSAAVMLHGGDVGRVMDIDLMMSSRDAENFLRRAGVEPKSGKASDRFRSAVFGTWSAPPVPAEVFGGFELAMDGSWRPVVLTSRQAISVGHSSVFVPSADELARLLRKFGRPKDFERARLLQS